MSAREWLVSTHRESYLLDKGIVQLLDAYARFQNAELRAALQWALDYIADGRNYADGESPKHDCGFNTEAAHCEFHEKFFDACDKLWGAEAALAEGEGTNGSRDA